MREELQQQEVCDIVHIGDCVIKYHPVEINGGVSQYLAYCSYNQTNSLLNKSTSEILATIRSENDCMFISEPVQIAEGLDIRDANTHEYKVYKGDDNMRRVEETNYDTDTPITGATALATGIVLSEDAIDNLAIGVQDILLRFYNCAKQDDDVGFFSCMEPSCTIKAYTKLWDSYETWLWLMETQRRTGVTAWMIEKITVDRKSSILRVQVCEIPTKDVYKLVRKPRIRVMYYLKFSTNKPYYLPWKPYHRDAKEAGHIARARKLFHWHDGAFPEGDSDLSPDCVYEALLSADGDRCESHSKDDGIVLSVARHARVIGKIYRIDYNINRS